ncbi:MAG: Tad domain-containing protein [Pirellulaceae bacterium]
MVLLAMLLFGLFAMAALVIDLGFARLTQRQMQVAADSAALEGLRYRDVVPPGATTTDTELARREYVRGWVANVLTTISIHPPMNTVFLKPDRPQLLVLLVMHRFTLRNIMIPAHRTLLSARLVNE